MAARLIVSLAVLAILTLPAPVAGGDLLTSLHKLAECIAAQKSFSEINYDCLTSEERKAMIEGWMAGEKKNGKTITYEQAAIAIGQMASYLSGKAFSKPGNQTSVQSPAVALAPPPPPRDIYIKPQFVYPAGIPFYDLATLLQKWNENGVAARRQFTDHRFVTDGRLLQLDEASPLLGKQQVEATLFIGRSALTACLEEEGFDLAVLRKNDNLIVLCSNLRGSIYPKAECRLISVRRNKEFLYRDEACFQFLNTQGK